MTADARAFLLERLSGSEFEALACDLLYAAGYVDLLPVGGMHDGGVDARLFRVSLDSGNWVVQISVQEDVQGKAAATLQRLLSGPSLPDGVLYVSNRPIPNRTKATLRKKAGVSDVLWETLGSEWVLPRVVVDDASFRLQPKYAAWGGIDALQSVNAELPASLRTVVETVRDSVKTPSVRAGVSFALSEVEISFFLRFHGSPGHAYRHAMNASRAAESHDSRLLSAVAAHSVGESLKLLSELHTAEAQFSRSLALAKECGLPLWESVCLANLAQIKSATEPAIALALAERSLAGKRSAGAVDTAVSLGQMADLHRRLGQWRPAHALARSSLELMDDVGAARGVAIATLRMADMELASAAPDLDLVEALLKRAGVSAEASGSGAVRAAVRIADGDMAARRGDTEAALQRYSEAMSHAIEHADKRLFAMLADRRSKRRSGC